MNPKKKEEDGALGRLPAMAPLANPYVPFQIESPPKYEARKALVRGTLFPGLDLPFHDMVNKTEKPVTPMTELQVMAFALQELALYLDTHRDDAEALELYRRYQQLLHDKRMEYVRKHGPLSHRDQTAAPEYEWLNDPWPWEYSGNQEV